MKHLLKMIIPAMCALSLISSCAQKSWMPGWFEKEHSVTYREILARPTSEQPSTITARQAYEDLDHFRYLIETSYAGYEYQKKFNGVDFKRNFNRARNYIRNLKADTITQDEFYKSLAFTMFGVQDGHLSIYNRISPYHHETFYHSGILITKQDKSFIVSSSSVAEVSKGEVYKGPEKYLFKTVSAEGERYRIGTLSRTPLQTLTLQFNTKKVTVPVSTDLNGLKPSLDFPTYSYVDGVSYLRIPTFSAADSSGIVTEAGLERLKEVEKAIKLLNKGDSVIVDVRSNSGGYVDTTALIPATVFNRYIKNFLTVTASLISPGTTQAKLWNVWDRQDKTDGWQTMQKSVQLEVDKQKQKPVRKWEYSSNRVEAAKAVENSRKLIIIINRYSYSASEILCSIRNIPNVTIIGENSGGVHTFSGGQMYVLPNSQIPLFLPDNILFDRSFSAGEGTGVLPDYWVLESELENALRTLTGSESFTLPAAKTPL